MSNQSILDQYWYYWIIKYCAMHRETHSVIKQPTEDKPIDEKLFKTAYNRAKSENRLPELLENTFHVMEMNRTNKKYPGAHDAEISQLMKSQMLNESAPQRHQSQESFLDMKSVYPLSKVGTFGSLYRQCKISENGIDEQEGTGKPKHKEITGFSNKIQKYGAVSNEKLEWIKNNKEYPFRIILHGSKKQQKAIYFKTKQEAQKVRIHYINKFLTKGDIKNKFKYLQQRYEDSIVTRFKYALVASATENKGKKSLVSKKLFPATQSVFEDKIESDKDNSRIFNESKIGNSPRASHVKKSNLENDDDDPLNDVVGITVHKPPAAERTDAFFRLTKEEEAKQLGRGQQDSFILSNQNQIDPRLFKLLQENYVSNVFDIWKEKAYMANKRNADRDRRIQTNRDKVQQTKYDRNISGYEESLKNRAQQEKDQLSVRRSENRDKDMRKLRDKFDASIREQSPPGKEGERQLISQPSSQLPHSSSQNLLAKSVLDTQSLGRISPKKSKPSLNSKTILSFKGIQFLKMTNPYMKPIVTVSVSEKGTIGQNQAIYNTMIKSKDPHLSYELIVNSGKETVQLQRPIDEYEVSVRVIDYLTNLEMFNDTIMLKGKMLSLYTLLLNKKKDMRIQMRCQGDVVNERYNWEEGEADEYFERNAQGCILEVRPLEPKIIQQIRTFWEGESAKRGYYNTSKDVKMIEILQLNEQMPKSWAIALQKKIFHQVALIASAASILNFKLLPSIIPILQVLNQIYSSQEELIEACISIMLDYFRPYYFPSEMNRPQKIHTLLGIKADLEFSSKISLEMQAFNKMVGIQCPELVQKYQRRNICFTHLVFQYIYEGYSKVFPIKTLVEVWNFCFQDPSMLQVYFLLLGVWLFRFYMNKLLLCRRFRQIPVILESQKTCVSDVIIRQLLVLRQKYFSKNKTLIDEIKGLFTSKPLDEVITEFYKTETNKIERRKETKIIEKNALLHRLNNEVQIELPVYPPRTYCFHIYFYQVLPPSGSLTIKANQSEYECLDYTTRRYFIIGQVTSKVTIQFTDANSIEYVCKIQMLQGVTKCILKFESATGETIQLQCICGLLTQAQIDAFKRNKNFEHYISSYSLQEEVKDEFIREQKQSILYSFTRKFDRDDLGKKLRALFSSGKKNFDEVDFYLRWIAVCPYTLPEKIALTKNYAENLSRECYLNNNEQLSKIFIANVLDMMSFVTDSRVFECHFADSIKQQFDAPKLIKCRILHSNGIQLKLEHLAIDYYTSKCQTNFYGDIMISELLAYILQKKESQLAHINQATLFLIISSDGQVKCFEIPILHKRNPSQLVIDESNYELSDFLGFSLATSEPEILITEVLPTFSKISTILQFVNLSKPVQSLAKPNTHRKLPENINLLRQCHDKIRRIIPMRFSTYPSALRIPFLEYYHDLLFSPVPPPCPQNIFLNNARTDLENIMAFKRRLKFHDNKGYDSNAQLFDKKLGLYGNLRLLQAKTDFVYFTSILQEDEPDDKELLFVNYGYGIYRWEPCKVEGYVYRKSQTESNLKETKKSRKCYVVSHHNKKSVVREFQVQIDPQMQATIPQYDSRPQTNSKHLQPNRTDERDRRARESSIGSNRAIY